MFGYCYDIIETRKEINEKKQSQFFQMTSKDDPLTGQ